MGKLVGEMDSKSIDILFAAFDRDNSGTVDVKELISGLSFLCRGSMEEKFTFLFETYDKDKSGTLDRKEVGIMLEELNTSLQNIHRTSVKQGESMSYFQTFFTLFGPQCIFCLL